MAAGRQLRVTAIPPEAEPTAIQVCLCEDDYPGWLAMADLAQLAAWRRRPYQVAAGDCESRFSSGSRR
jgi:hypothetical protein